MIQISNSPYNVKLYVSIEKNLELSFSKISNPFTNRVIKINKFDEFVFDIHFYEYSIIPILLNSNIFDNRKSETHYFFKLNDFGKLSLI